jgi:hypothetical protein
VDIHVLRVCLVTGNGYIILVGLILVVTIIWETFRFDMFSIKSKFNFFRVLPLYMIQIDIEQLLAII